ncbi:dual specificity protein phosphatase 3 [Parasteatoda tepidariorum]|uniref:dual specificity protein phosphatase 3 n=1 Tax=Parasteatoda tepidariorum TaxID=114398 RepID=UPI001C7237F1|nr:dual specificity protein phosphatase 3-like [Parasteatoda tepidariorum]
MHCTVDEAKGICLFPYGKQEYPTEDMDEVYPGIYIGNSASAANLAELKAKNVKYVLNSAFGTDSSLKMVHVLSEKDYTQSGISFLGVPAVDHMSYSISEHFNEALVFIKGAVTTERSILVHCVEGISRSATLVLAYLVKEVGMNLQEAIRSVRQRREILPNDGFLLQLCILNESRNKKL